MSIAELRDRAKELSQVYWYQTMRLFPDLVIEGAKSEATLEAERAVILGLVDLAGRSVLDVGAWNGYFTFEAKRAGASRVLATDSYAWRSPQFRGRETFELARACLGIDVDARDIDPTELPGDIAPVDVVLFIGVFYHMVDPIMVLQKVASLATDLLVVETHQDLLLLDRPAMVFYPGTTLANDATNWWGPNPACVTELLEPVGFRHVFYQRHPVSVDRGIYHAFRSAETARRYLRRAADNATLFDLASDAGGHAVFGAASEGLSTRFAAERDAALAELAAMRRSTSWVLTAPLRAVRSACTGLTRFHKAEGPR